MLQDKRNVLHHAAISGCSKIVSALMYYGRPDIRDAKDNFLKTALHYACELGHADVLTELIKAKADVNCDCGNEVEGVYRVLLATALYLIVRPSPDS